MSAAYRVPDPLMSLIDHLRGDSVSYWPVIAARLEALHEFCAPEYIDVRASRNDGNHILVRNAGGFGDKRDALGGMDFRTDITAYSQQLHVARTMILIVRDIIEPVEKHLRGWTANYTRVIDAHSFTTPRVDTEPREPSSTKPGWPYGRMTGHLTYSRVAREMAVSP